MRYRHVSVVGLWGQSFPAQQREGRELEKAGRPGQVGWQELSFQGGVHSYPAWPTCPPGQQGTLGSSPSRAFQGLLGEWRSWA